MIKEIQIEKDGELTPLELNNLLKTNNWQIDSITKLEDMLRKSWCYITARDKNNRLIGFVQTLSDDIFHAYILRLIVHPDFRGKGIGSSIFQELMNILEQHNLKPTLVATPGNKEFYEKFGFKQEIHGLTAMCMR